MQVLGEGNVGRQSYSLSSPPSSSLCEFVDSCMRFVNTSKHCEGRTVKPSVKVKSGFNRSLTSPMVPGRSAG